MLSQQFLSISLSQLETGLGYLPVSDSRRAPPDHHMKPLVYRALDIDCSILFRIIINFSIDLD